jgi:hypothetical protein
MLKHVWEIEEIFNEKTYSTCYHHNTLDIGCNFTLGGDGVTGKILNTRARAAIGDAQRGKPKSLETKRKINDALTGRELSSDVRSRMSEVKRGKPLSLANRQNLWMNREKTFSDSHRKSLTLAAKVRKCSVCRKTGHKRTTCPQALEGEQSCQT